MARLIIFSIAIVTLFAVVIAANPFDDPFGTTQREKIRSDAALRIAQEEANARVQVETVRQTEETERTRISAKQIPILVFGGGTVFIVITLILCRTLLERETIRANSGVVRVELIEHRGGTRFVNAKSQKLMQVNDTSEIKVWEHNGTVQRWDVQKEESW
jgi:hypothetical protein